ncbi:general secretion pathway protein I [Luteibacter rhizovicinus]|uniref:General secretion pathway protein I n=1 Tax=Luteibacter rhizovicinus TaxID=242606 RepID=A0A4R3YFY9_9GAMM|nr:prepilin-type N-terminal cleavage/methylation domain-containing protein [Luteibacter rhizovicinus]TCV91050.1 general secretion pathway protein I [Luteibacter rhizovicinus]
MTPSRGFSLLEVIAALLLLAIAFGAVMQVAGASMHLTSRSTTLSRSTMWADTKMESVGYVAPLVAGTSEGRFDDTYRWSMTIAPVVDGTQARSELHLYRLELDVLWREGVTDRKAHFTTLRVQDEPHARSMEPSS